MSLRTQSEVRELGGVARELPYQLRDVMEQTRQGKLEIQIRNPGFDDLTLPHRPRREPDRGGADRRSAGSSARRSWACLAKDGPHVMGLHLLVVRRLRHLGRLRRLARLGHRPVRPVVACTGSQPAVPCRRSSSTGSCGSACTIRPSRPVVSTAAQSALSTASSVASTVAAKSGSRCASGTDCSRS